ncbi:MAG: M28 family peptidase [Bacteroidales bacterium]
MKKNLIVIALGILLIGCKSENQNQEKVKIENQTIVMPTFDSDSAFSYVKAQTDFGPRVPNTESHQLCASYLEKKLVEFCDTVFIQPFTAVAYDGKKLASKNIIGSFSPEKESRILLAAHWDSRPMADHDPNPDNRNKAIDGANDGASGVGVLLEVARQLQLKNPEIGVDIVFFDAEDYGTPESVDIPGDWWCLGAQYWARNQHVKNYHADFGIVLDMVGASDAKFYHEGISSYYAQDVIAKIWSAAYKLGHGNYFINQSANPVTDDHYYVNKIARIKMIDIIHQDMTTGTGFCSVWHTTHDQIDQIDKAPLQAVGTTLLEIIYNEKH